MITDFSKNYTRWLDDCLAEYNQKFGDTRKYHSEPDSSQPVPADFFSGNFVEFSEDGAAHPHSSMGGTNWIPNCVTPWAKSPHYTG